MAKRNSGLVCFGVLIYTNLIVDFEPPVTFDDLQCLRAIAEPIYRKACDRPFEMVINDGWNLLEEDGGDRINFYVSIRLDFANDSHWFMYFKVPDVLFESETLFSRDAASLAQASVPA